MQLTTRYVQGPINAIGLTQTSDPELHTTQLFIQHMANKTNIILMLELTLTACLDVSHTHWGGLKENGPQSLMCLVPS